MHLALIIDDYLPYSTRVGAKMFHDLAKELIRQGHQVTVITPHFDEAKASFVQDTVDGVNVWRFLSGQIKDVSKITRAMNETLLSHKAWHAIEGQVDKMTFDGVVYYSPSIFFGPLVGKLKKRCQCNSYMVLRDFFPQWAIDSGIIRSGSLIERYFRWFENIAYKQADSIGVMSQRNLDIFNRMTKGRFSSSVLRNWASLAPHKVKEGAINLRNRLGLVDEVIYFYGGNIGHAQDMPNLMRLVKEMQHYNKAHFLFVGQGDEVGLIQDLANKWQLTNFTFMPSVSQDDFKDILAQVDVGLFSLSASHTTHNFPGKLLGYMTQSLPILGSVNQGNDLIELVNDNAAGLIGINGDDCELLKNAVLLLESGLRDRIGDKGNKLLRDEFSVTGAAKAVISSLSDGGYYEVKDNRRSGRAHKYN